MADAKHLEWGSPMTLSVQTTGAGTHIIDASTDQVEFIFASETTDAITHLGVRVSAVTSPPVLIISLQGVDASGVPDGTIKGGGSPASATFTPAAGWTWVALANSYTPTNRGEVLAIVVAYSSGTVGASNTATLYLGYSGINWKFPYAIGNNAGARTLSTTGWPVFGYRTASARYGTPVVAPATVAYNSGTGTADEYGMKFTVPTSLCYSYKIRGIRAFNVWAAGGTSIVILYSGTTTAASDSTGATSETTKQQTVTYDHDHVVAVSGGPTYIFFDEASLVTLYAGATYRLTIQPQTANSTTAQYIDVAETSDWQAYRHGEDVGQSTRLNDSGNFTDNTLRRLVMELILDDITQPESVPPFGVAQPVLIGNRLQVVGY